MAQRNSFSPPYYFRPDHLETQLSYLAFQAWSHLFGGGSPEVLFQTNHAPFYALARTISALFGTAAIAVAFFIGASYRASIGLWSAVMIAFFPPFVEHSRYATPDMPLVFTMLLVILGCVRYVQQERWGWLALASAGIALGITAKYPAVVGTAAIAAAIIIASLRSGHPWRILTRGAASIGMVAGFTFAISPSLFTNFSAVRKQLFQQNSTGHLGADGLDWSGNAAFYANDLVNSTGVILVAIALIGLVQAIRNRRWDMVPLLTGLVFWVALSALTLHWDRWGLPMYLTPLLLAGVGADVVLRWAAARRLPAKVVVRTVTGLSFLSLLLGSSAQLASALAPDTRLIAAVELADRGIDPDETYFDGYTPFLTDGPRNLASELTVADDGAIQPREGVEELPYILTSSRMVGRYLAATTMPEERLLYSTIQKLRPETVWRTVGIPPASPWEPWRIWQTVTYIRDVVAGGHSGPQLILYQMPRVS
ncbi:ArnT family glycosyltransferase [Microbacterium sp. YJN-G]|uniref:ArnT family glycosyltransferase n=1 Tax=Microbacterium sp. YJN-G TaxID=2763257 RepID=UPI001D0C3833|nr:glycosyltransferase family 39 protein [Microbacterium sp. YJN-G]